MSAPTNPVVRATTLLTGRSWVVRQYADGTYDAFDTNGVALSPVYSTFEEALTWARSTRD